MSELRLQEQILLLPDYKIQMDFKNLFQYFFVFSPDSDFWFCRKYSQYDYHVCESGSAANNPLLILGKYLYPAGFIGCPAVFGSPGKQREAKVFSSAQFCFTKTLGCY